MVSLAFDKESGNPSPLPRVSQMLSPQRALSFLVVGDRSVKLAGMHFVQLAFWKGLSDALHTCCCPAGDCNEREGAVFTVCQVLCWGLGASGGVRKRGGSTPNKMVFKTSHMQKESIPIRGQLLNMPCMMGRVECIFWAEVELCISGCLCCWICDCNAALPEVSAVCYKCPAVSVHKKDGPGAAGRKEHFLGLP